MTSNNPGMTDKVNILTIPGKEDKNEMFEVWKVITQIEQL
jgi:hypothetical protein